MMDDPSQPEIQLAEPTAPPRPHARRWWLAGGLAVILVILAGAAVIYFNKPSLEERDPAGARACQLLKAWQTGDMHADKFVAAVAIGDQAAKSASASIKKAGGEPVLNLRIANLHDVWTACKAEGVKMPPWVES